MGTISSSITDRELSEIQEGQLTLAVFDFYYNGSGELRHKSSFVLQVRLLALCPVSGSI